MVRIPRLYQQILTDHLSRHRQMAFVAGPRQVGKTTTCRSSSRDARYLDWDDQDHRRLILKGPAAVAAEFGVEQLSEQPTVLVLDELHKYARWKTFLKGLHDRYSDRMQVLVTGSSRLDVYRRGGDSLMGRYLLYRMHPLSVGELLRQGLATGNVANPKRLSPARFRALWEHGGFPEPFSKKDVRFSRQWRRLRRAQLLREDIRDTTRIQELDQLDVLAAMLEELSGGQVVYSSFARDINVSVDTVRRWIGALVSLHHGFLVRPWFRNVKKSLRKEPKWYLRDWSGIRDPGRRAETFVACHLLKAVETWTDLGIGEFELRHLRDKEKREVDLVVIRDGEPWFLVEVKQRDVALSPQLRHFQEQTGAPHAFQVVVELDYVDADPFSRTDPCVVAARTLLSQLP
ncbi:MAG: AAA family ATPase [Planctomycetota bacterium]